MNVPPRLVGFDGARESACIRQLGEGLLLEPMIRVPVADVVTHTGLHVTLLDAGHAHPFDREVPRARLLGIELTVIVEADDHARLHGR